MAKGVPLDRVVAVVAKLPDGRRRWGSGFLVTPTQVLTAWHCTVADPESAAVVPLQVRRFRDGAWQAAAVTQVTSSRTATATQGVHGLDLSLLALREPPWAGERWTCPPFARVDRSTSGELTGCEAVGYPMYRLEGDGELTSMEVNGFIRQGEGLGGGTSFLTFRDDRVGDLEVPPAVADEQGTAGSAWGGISGALVFHEGRVLGHVVQHRPHLGNNPLTVVPVERWATASGAGARKIAAALGLGPADGLPWAGAVAELAGLVDLLGDDGDLPFVRELTPYQLGADPTHYGDTGSHGKRDPYLPRTAGDVDRRLDQLLAVPDRLVLVVGPSKAGKTRTAFEALRRGWPDARLTKPDPSHLVEVVRHPRVADTDWPLVMWLDDIQRFMTGDKGLTPALLRALVTRRGPTVVMATLRQEERARFAESEGLTAGARQLLDDAVATTVELAPTSEDPEEQAAARAAYPELDLDEFGLAEQLAGAPALLRCYLDAPPLLRAVLQSAVDWERVGITTPVPQDDLVVLAREQLKRTHPYLDPTPADLAEAVVQARQPPMDADRRTTGQLAALVVHRQPDDSWSYSPYPYLVAHDNGQDAPVRPVPGPFWELALDRAPEWEAESVGTAAYSHGRIPIAVKALMIAASLGSDQAMRNLGWLHANETEPVDLDVAEIWYLQAVAHGNASAMRSYGILLAEKRDPPDREKAREWYQRAADAGNLDARVDLADLLAYHLDRLDEALVHYREAVAQGSTRAMLNLGRVLENKVEPRDPDQARVHYERAAMLGEVDAMTDLADLLSKDDERQDLPTARHWYQEAAERGNVDAMTNLGYLLGDQLQPPDLTGARHWYEKAAALGSADAARNLGVLLSSQLDPPEVEAARAAYERAAALGSVTAKVNLGWLLAEQVQPPDLAGARAWYEQAAEEGDVDAMNRLAGVLQREPADLVAARHWFEKAAATGDVDAQLGLGYLLADDEPRTARNWFGKAADAGSTEAMVWLALDLADADPPDLDGAVTWSQKAWAHGDISGLVHVGAWRARLGNRAGAESAWEAVLGEERTDESMCQAALALAALAALDGADARARALLDTAAAHGAESAATYAAVLDPATRATARAQLLALADDTDALNFLGLAARDDGDPDAAAELWRRSAESEDMGAPLLLAAVSGT